MNKEVRKISSRMYRMTIHQRTMLRSSFAKKLWWCPWDFVYVNICDISEQLFERVYILRDTYRSRRTDRTLLRALLLLSTQNFKSGFSRFTVVYISPSHVEVPSFLIPPSLCTCRCAPDPFFWPLVSCTLQMTPKAPLSLSLTCSGMIPIMISPGITLWK